ncbi:MAG TPA: imidazolonepropionase [Firmicutes bacterium]|nr:imidazolonepropionase [Bacillota bacterium]
MKIFYNIKQLLVSDSGLPVNGPEQNKINILENSALVTDGELIHDYGDTDHIFKKYPDAERIDLRGNIVFPGFIDPHTHPVFGGTREDEFAARLQGVPYSEIAKSGGGIFVTVRQTREASKEELLASTLKVLDSMLKFGITTIEAKSGYGLDRNVEIKMLEVLQEADRLHPIDIISTYLGGHTIPTEFQNRPRKYIDFMLKEVMPEIKERGLARYTDIWCEALAFNCKDSEYYLKKSREMGFDIRLHANELSSFGGGIVASNLRADSADHMVYTSDNEIREMEEAGVVATLLPGTMFNLKSEVYAPAQNFIDFGVHVALGTDFNPGSCMSENIQMIMVLSAIQMDMTPEEVINAVTINAAYSLRLHERIGSITRGKKADFIVLNIPNYFFIFYHWGFNPVEQVYKKGSLVYSKNEGVKHVSKC